MSALHVCAGSISLEHWLIIEPGARFSKLPVVTGPVKLTGVSTGLKIVQ